jgi:hypothetical protein
VALNKATISASTKKAILMKRSYPITNLLPIAIPRMDTQTPLWTANIFAGSRLFSRWDDRGAARLVHSPPRLRSPGTCSYFLQFGGLSFQSGWLVTGTF